MLLLENISHDEFKKYVKEFYNYALEHLNLDRPPKIVFKKDKSNSEDMFGKTGFYDPEEEKIALFITDRHPKDVLRSFAHELIHHEQKCRGDDKNLNLSLTSHDPAYASHDEGLREMEREAFERGNMLFRDWCDMKKLEKKGENIMTESKLVEKILERVTKRLTKKVKPKPDFIDLDKDRNREETMKKAAQDAKKMKKEAGVGSGEPEGVEDLSEVKKMKCESCGSMYEESEKHSCKEAKNESKELPYPELFAKKERVFNDRFSQHEQWKFEELLKRAIKNK